MQQPAGGTRCTWNDSAAARMNIPRGTNNSTANYFAALSHIYVPMNAAHEPRAMNNNNLAMPRLLPSCYAAVSIIAAAIARRYARRSFFPE